jgi:hypothetical protein
MGSEEQWKRISCGNLGAEGRGDFCSYNIIKCLRLELTFVVFASQIIVLYYSRYIKDYLNFIFYLFVKTWLHITNINKERAYFFVWAR